MGKKVDVLDRAFFQVHGHIAAQYVRKGKGYALFIGVVDGFTASDDIYFIEFSVFEKSGDGPPPDLVVHIGVYPDEGAGVRHADDQCVLVEYEFISFSVFQVQVYIVRCHLVAGSPYYGVIV